MKVKLIVSGLMIFGLMNTQAMSADCMDPTDWFAKESSECVYCAGDLSWTTAAGLTCMAKMGQKCDHGTDANLSKHGYCVYCSEGYKFDKEKKECVAK